MTPKGTDGNWTICSVAPYGRYVGSFSLVSSGAQATFDLRVSGFCRAAVATWTATNNTIHFRLITQRTGASSLTFPNNSAWVSEVSLGAAHLISQPFMTTHSLGPGDYSVELQMQFDLTISASSDYTMDQNDYLVLSVLETRA